MSRNGKTVQCQLCHRDYKRITQSHLEKEHPGVSLEDYRAVYGPTTPGEVTNALMAKQAGPIAALVLQELQNDESLINDVARRVGNALFSDQFRGKLVGAAAMVLAERAGAYGRLRERVEKVEEELFRPERVYAGGPFGSPTPTETLVAMQRVGAQMVRDTEDTLLRLIKAGIDDGKASKVELNINQTFSGKHETIVVPESLDSKHREGLRRVLSRMTRKPRTLAEAIERAREDEDDIQEAEFEAVEK
jgi:hypothetical protein